jgi:hypothetical protein
MLDVANDPDNLEWCRRANHLSPWRYINEILKAAAF